MLDKISNYIGLVLILAGIIVFLGISLLQGLFYLASLIPPSLLETSFKILNNWGPIGLALPLCVLVILVGIIVLIIELHEKKVGIDEVIKK
jgi:hypothetical protein